jgi:hypothetical protein
MKAKELSLFSKIFAGSFVLAAWILCAAFRWDVATWDIIQVGIFMALIFSPVDVSIWMDKFGRRQE